MTGGGRGIGAGIARELAAAGMGVAVAARSGEQVEEVAHEIGRAAIQAVVSDQASVADMVARVEHELNDPRMRSERIDLAGARRLG